MKTGRLRSFVRAAMLAFTLCLVLAAPALAQETGEEAPAESKGICAPWHRCMAIGGVAITGLVVGALGVGYLIQSRGFDTVEHRMGQPQGTPVKKE